eukprot:GGOE01065465.1.p1 GENE.GGOE01065465.1~~GGOE01065465.1.p1  ORF type:complete len:464 (-),score=83.60 GGOE01065465.1:354-1745(-)
MAFETDPHRLEQRQKQIDFGLATTGYANYVACLKSNPEQVKPIPIPNIYVKCSKRSWDGQIKHWRRLLHIWDEGMPEDRHLQDPNAVEDAEWVDPEPTPPPKPVGRRPKAKPAQPFSTRPHHSNFQYPTPQQYYPVPVHFMPQPHHFAAQLPPSHPGTLIPHPMHLHPKASYQHPQQTYQPLPPQMVSGMAPSAIHAMGMYQVPPPSWQLSYVPAGYPAVPSMYTPMEEGIGLAPCGIDVWLQVEQEEAAGRSAVWDEEATALQALLYQQYVMAMGVAASAHRELAHHPSKKDAHNWTETGIGLLLNDFSSSSSCCHTNPVECTAGSSSLLPPSLAEPRPGAPDSPTAASDTHSLASFVDLSLDEERYHNFRLHFGEATTSQGSTSLESPPPCWSPARFTPAFAPQRAPMSASPGLTPSPHDWLAQRSPVQVSPRGPLAFPDWSPHPEQLQEKKASSTPAPDE